MDSSNLENLTFINNKPRLLTDEEIADILSVIPKIKSAASEVAVYNEEYMFKTLKEQFKEILVTPLAIDDMKDEVLRQFMESVIKAGTSVGVNAAEAMGGKGVITLKARKFNEEVEIRVSDTGPGIPSEVIPRLFEPLVTTKEKGNGFGLPTTKLIIEKHGGTITAQSEPGIGTTFIIRLPLD